jgi:hypothetical protein
VKRRRRFGVQADPHFQRVVVDPFDSAFTDSIIEDTNAEFASFDAAENPANMIQPAPFNANAILFDEVFWLEQYEVHRFIER